jgi:hypothetical protein
LRIMPLTFVPNPGYRPFERGVPALGRVRMRLGGSVRIGANALAGRVADTPVCPKLAPEPTVGNPSVDRTL